MDMLRRECRSRGAVLALLIAGAQPGCGEERLGPPSTSEASCTVSTVIDGDSLRCADGRELRLLLIDAPELGQTPWGDLARAALLGLAPIAARLSVELDVEHRDDFGRYLTYLHGSDGTLVNERLAWLGYAVPLIIPPNGRYEARIRAAVADAEAAERGLWAEWRFACLPADYRTGRCT
jgi:endonuclease YncB( thermonuclease family)